MRVPGCLRPPTGRTRRRLRSGSYRRGSGVGDGDETVARRIGIVTGHDDDFLARTEPFAKPHGGGVEHGSAGYAEGLRQGRAERRSSRRDERGAAMRKAFVVGAGVMGAAVVAAATFTVLVFAGLFTVSSGVGGGNRPVTLVQQPPAPTTPAPAPSDATDPTPPSDPTGTFPPSTTAQTGRSPLPSSNRVAVPRARPARKFRRSRHRHRAGWSNCPRFRRPLRAPRLPRRRRRHRHRTRIQRGTRLPDATSRELPRQPSEA